MALLGSATRPESGATRTGSSVGWWEALMRLDGIGGTRGRWFGVGCAMTLLVELDAGTRVLSGETGPSGMGRVGLVTTGLAHLEESDWLSCFLGEYESGRGGKAREPSSEGLGALLVMLSSCKGALGSSRTDGERASRAVRTTVAPEPSGA
jgi:hypothetical protein